MSLPSAIDRRSHPPLAADDRPAPLGRAEVLVVLWATLGVLIIVGRALASVTPWAVEALQSDLSPLQWVVLVGWTGVMGVLEGYRGFQLRFSPRVVQRALHLAQHRRPLHVLLAPLFAMGLFHASRKRLATSWGMIGGIALLVLGVRYLPQPWRGIVDLGVVVGLTWGLASLLWLVARALRGRAPGVDPELPAR